MSRPRVADDFPAIRARMHELRRESIPRPRVADDFATIRARIGELRSEDAALRSGTGRGTSGNDGRGWPAVTSARRQKA